MKFKSNINEAIFVAEIFPERQYMFDKELTNGLSVIWNRGRKADFKIDNRTVSLETNCIFFLTEYHVVDDYDFQHLNVLQFNRPFYCIDEDKSDIGCKGLLFFGASDIPKISIPQERVRQFELIWEVFLMEIDEHDELKLEMLQALLRRFLILCMRVYKDQNLSFPSDSANVGLIKEYNYLVEKNFKKFTKVSDYARLLHKSPKTLSNTFKKYIEKTPLQIINERRLLEAQRLLKYTNRSIQEIADEINFIDIQSFSHFFKSKSGVSPSQFREELTVSN